MFFSSHHLVHLLQYCVKCNSIVQRGSWCDHPCNAKNHQCIYCTYSTRRSENLRRHVKSKHLQRSSNSNINSNNPDPPIDILQDLNPPTPTSSTRRTPGAALALSVLAPGGLICPLTSFMTVLIILMILMVSHGFSGSLLCPPGASGGMVEIPIDDDEMLEPAAQTKLPLRRRGRPPGKTWHTCTTCGFLATTSKRLKSHERKHDRELRRAGMKWHCKYAENGCEYVSKYKSNLKRHENTPGRCRFKPRVPKQLDGDTCWELISLFPMSNKMACQFLHKLEKLIGFKFTPPCFQKEMKDHLNCTMQFLESEIVQYKVKH